MINPINPTVEEIWEWAWDEKSLAPMEDWDIIIQNLYPAEYVKIAKLPHCPCRNYFLSLIYLYVGDSYRTNNWNRVDPLLKDHENSESHVIFNWVKQSNDLRSGKVIFNYDDWCGGKLARNALGQNRI